MTDQPSTQGRTTNERHVGELLQTEYDELLARLVEADSYVSWCRHRHHNPVDVQREMDDFIVFARKHGRPRTVTASTAERKRSPSTDEYHLDLRERNAHD